MACMCADELLEWNETMQEIVDDLQQHKQVCVLYLLLYTGIFLFYIDVRFPGIHIMMQTEVRHENAWSKKLL